MVLEPGAARRTAWRILRVPTPGKTSGQAQQGLLDACARRGRMAVDNDFRHESVQDRQSIVKYLQAITAGIEQGRLELGTSEHSLTLEPTGMLELQVRGKRKGGRVKFGIELHWREEDEEP